MKPCDTPCPQCPFARSTPKTYLDTKGDNGERFIGQSIGPFVLPCHMTREFGSFRERFVNDEPNPPCVGAAIYRANIGVHRYLPPQVTDVNAKPDFETVFSSPEELLAHHRGISIEEAYDRLAITPPHELLLVEFNSATATHKLIPKD
jgi:hypothetical protein